MSRAKFYNTNTLQWEYFDFAPAGATGPLGPTGPIGPTGPVGAAITIIGSLANVGLLPGSGTTGDAYVISGDLWVWDGSAWVDVGPVEGATGATGPTGIQGATGPAPNEWLNGSGAPAGGTGNIGDYYVDNDTSEYYEKTGASTWTLLGVLGSSVSGTGTVIEVSQVGHSFVVGNVLRSSGTDGEYTKAQANSEANAEVIGVVTEVIDTNTFAMTTYGRVAVAAAVPNELAGTVLYLSETTAGLLTSTEPTGLGEVSKPVAIVIDGDTEMTIVNMRGVVLDATMDDVIDADTLGGSTKGEFLLKDNIRKFTMWKTGDQATGTGGDGTVSWQSSEEYKDTTDVVIANDEWVAPSGGWLDISAYLSISEGSAADDTLNWGFYVDGTAKRLSTDNWRYQTNTGLEYLTTMSAGFKVSASESITVRWTGITTDDITILSTSAVHGTFTPN